MNLISRYALLAALATAPALALGDDVSAVRKEIEALKQAYEARIEALERKLKTLEREQAAQAARAPVPAPQPVAANSGQVTAGSAFNPQLSVILDGVFFTDDAGGDGGALPGEAYGVFHGHGHGHGHEHEHGGVDRGFNLRETEIAFSATVDPYFDAAAYFAVSSDGDFEVEEAFLASRSLPAGLRVKAGKFLSDIGYLNNQHPHQWDFVDQNLPYLNLLGPHGLNDTGVQVTWLPDWPVYTLFGVELLQGDQEKIGALVDDEDAEEVAADLGIGEGELGLSREDHGPRLYTAFAKVGPDLGPDHALQLGAWVGYAQQQQEIHAHEGEPVHVLEGDVRLWGLDAVHKYDSGRAYGDGDWKIQAEYLRAVNDRDLVFREGGLPADTRRKGTEDGFYVQGWYGVAPRWRAGVRYDAVGLTNQLESSSTTLAEWDSSDRWTFALSWLPTEFSTLRLQYSSADITLEDGSDRFGSLYLQYIVSLGAHGAHKF